MRFRGGGVGHKATRTATNFLKDDRDKLDFERRQARSDNVEPNEEQAEDHGDSDSESEDEFEGVESDEEAEDGSDSGDMFEDDEFGPEDDGGVLLDDDMEVLGYAPL